MLTLWSTTSPPFLLFLVAGFPHSRGKPELDIGLSLGGGVAWFATNAKPASGAREEANPVTLLAFFTKTATVTDYLSHKMLLKFDRVVVLSVLQNLAWDAAKNLLILLGHQPLGCSRGCTCPRVGVWKIFLHLGGLSFWADRPYTTHDVEKHDIFWWDSSRRICLGNQSMSTF